MCNISQQICQHIVIIVRVPKRTYHELSNKNLSEDDFLRIFPDQNSERMDSFHLAQWKSESAKKHLHLPMRLGLPFWNMALLLGGSSQDEVSG